MNLFQIKKCNEISRTKNNLLFLCFRTSGKNQTQPPARNKTQSNREFIGRNSNLTWRNNFSQQ